MAVQMLRVAEVANNLACSERTIRRWIADGTLPSIKINGIRLIPEEGLNKLLGADEPAWLEGDCHSSSSGSSTEISDHGSTHKLEKRNDVNSVT